MNTSQDDRKAAIRKYKESYRPTGVYRVTVEPTGEALLGSSPNLPAIWNRIRMQLRTGSYLRHRALQERWKEHGEEAFRFEVLEELEAPDAPGWDPTDDLAALLELWCEQLGDAVTWRV